MNGAARLRMTGIAKSYGAVQALRGVDFEIQPGEVVALLGENGAGKTTLVKILAGLVNPDDGIIEVDGTSVTLGSSRRAQAHGIAVVQQEYSSVPTLSVAENVFLGARPAGWLVRRGRLAAAARPHLEQVGLCALDPATPVEQLSVAERQLVEIARLLARDASILLFDEPTAALSDSEIDRVLEVVRRLAADGRSIIYVTHRLAEVFRIADRVTVFRNGTSLAPVATKHLDIDQVVAMMLGRRIEALFPPRASRLGADTLAVTGLLTHGLSAPVDLRARRGEIIGLTGQMGAGASAVLRAVAGVSPVLAGTVTVKGTQLDRGGRAAGIRRGVAYCSDDRGRDGIFAGLSVRQNLSSPWLRQIASTWIVRAGGERAQAAAAAASMAIDGQRLGSAVGTLSGGNQQKVALGKWVAPSTSVLLVEEPTRGVDIGARAEIYQQLRSLCEREQLAVVVASSDTSEILGLCDTIGAMYRGVLVEVRPQDAWTEEELVRRMLYGTAQARAVTDVAAGVGES